MHPSVERLPRWRHGRVAWIVALVLILVSLPFSVTTAQSQEADVQAQASALVDEFLSILELQGDEKHAQLETFLADEFQIVRANGSHLDKSGYLENSATVQRADVTNLEATMSDGVIVASYALSVEETIDGVQQSTLAPRLSVFRQSADGSWHIVAHANFGALDPQP